MALTATFSADFTSFLDACQKATVSLKQVEDGAANVTTRLDHMTNAFTGRAIIQQAILTAEAVERVGGVSKLTADELQRVGSVASQAAEKLRAYGKDVPANVQKLADAASAARSPFTQLNETLGKVGLSLGSLSAAGIVSGLVAVGKSALDTASNLVDLSNKTGVGLDSLQRMSYVAKQSGATVQDYADAIFKLGTNVQKGGADVQNAVAKMGLSFQDFKALSPEEQFNAIVTNMDKLGPTAERNKALLDLFGKGVSATVAGLVDNYKQLAGQATVATDQQIKALSDAKNAWEGFYDSLITKAESFLGNLVRMNQAQDLRNSKDFANQIAIAQGIPFEEARFNLWRMSTDQILKLNENLKGQHDVLLKTTPAVESYVGELAAARAELSAAAGVPGLLAEAQAGIELARSTEQIRASTGLTAAAIELYKKQLQDATAAQRNATTEAERFATATASYEETLARMRELFDDTALRTGDWAYQLLAAGASMEDVGRVTGMSAGEVRTLNQEVQANKELASDWAAWNMRVHADVLKDWQKFIDGQIAEANRRGKAIADNYKAEAKATADLMHEEEQTRVDGYDAQIAAARRTSASIQSIVNLQLQRENALYVQRIRDIQADGKAREAGLTAGVAGYQQAFDTIQQIVDERMQQARQKHEQAVAGIIDDARKIEPTWSAALGDVGKMFAQMAIIGGGAFPEIGRDIGQVATAVSGLSKAMHELTSDQGGKLNYGQLAALAATWVGVAIAVYQVATAIWSWHEKQKKLNALLDEGKIIAFDFGRTWSQAFSPSLVKAIDDSSNSIYSFLRRGGLSGDQLTQVNGEMARLVAGTETLAGAARHIAEALNIVAVVKELGGLTPKNIAMVEDRLQDLLDVITIGGPDAAKAMDALGTELKDVGTYFEQHGGLWDQTFAKLVQDSQKLGGDVGAQATQMLAGQTDKAAKGLTTFLAAGAGAYDTIAKKQAELIDLQAQYADASAENAPKIKKDIDAATAAIETQRKILQATAITTQQGADAAGAGLLGTFGLMLKQGKSLADAVAAVGPGVSALQTQLDATGLSGGDAFAVLQRMVALTSDAVAGPALTAVSGLNDALLGLQNTGILNQAMFAGLADQVGQTYDSLIAQGKDGNAALLAMQPTLQTIWQLEQDYGYTVDDSTQKLVDQAVQQGIVGEEHKSVADKMLEATKRISDAVEGLAHAFGVTLPSDMDKTAKAGTEAAKKLKDELDKVPKSIKVGVDYTGAGPLPPPPPAPTTAEPHATGGVIGGGGAIAAPVLFTPQGTDTVPAMLTPGEQVLTVDESRRYRAGGGGGDTYIIQPTINALDADNLQITVERKVIPAMVDAIRVNRRQSRTDMRAVLGVSSDVLGAGH